MRFHGYPYSNFPGQVHYRRVLPQASPDLFMASARKIRPLFSEAGVLANKIASSREFSRAVMNAAQASQTETVRKMMISSGIRKDARVTYNPDGITIDLAEQGCCMITIFIRWR